MRVRRAFWIALFAIAVAGNARTEELLRSALPASNASFEVSSVSSHSPLPLDVPEGAKADSDIMITLKEKALVVGEKVTLGEVAEIAGGDTKEIDRLKAIEIGSTPKIGATGKLALAQVQLVLKAASIQHASIKGSREVVVERQSMQLDMDAVREELENRLRAELPYDENQVAITHAQLPEEILLPKGALRLEVEFKMPQRMLGQISYAADFQVNGRSAKKLNGAMNVQVQTKALQAMRTIARGDVLHAEDFRETDLSQRGTPRNLVCLLPDAKLGARAKSDIPLGQILTEDMIERPVAMAKNASINLLVQRGPLKITATAVAREAGSPGDVIRTMNQSSGREVMARVIDSRTAEVVY